MQGRKGEGKRPATKLITTAPEKKTLNLMFRKTGEESPSGTGGVRLWGEKRGNSRRVVFLRERNLNEKKSSWRVRHKEKRTPGTKEPLKTSLIL